MPYVEGLIRQVFFFREDNGYSVFKLEIIDTTEPNLLYHEPTVVISGFFPKLETQTRYRFYGEFVDHPKYGTQYKASRFERILENTKEGIVEYLSSGLFKGIGPKTAKKIVDVLGLDCLDQIANDFTVLDKVKKMPLAKKQEIYTTLRDNRAMESTLIWLYGFEISPKMSFKIVQKYGHRTVDVVKSNPYVLIDDVEGIGFKRADDIGLKVGFSPDSPLRIRAVLFYLLNEYMNKFGDTMLDKSKLVEYTLTFLNREDQTQIEANTVNEMIDQQVAQNRLVEIGDVIMLAYLYNAEMELAKKLRLLAERHDQETPEAIVEEHLDWFETQNDIRYTTNQRDAVSNALLHHLVVITGGPGTGKTTIIKAIVDIYQRLHSSEGNAKSQIRLVAPTGKAAKRLSEATSCEATTIHRLLGYDFTGLFAFDEGTQIPAKLIIIDEASMMDVMLAKHLFLAIHPDTKVVVVGDENQLPSVGPGQVLADLLAAKICPVVRLTKIHRQALGSAIVDLAYQVLNQEMPESLQTPTSDRVFLRVREADVPKQIEAVVSQAIKDGYDLKDDIQILIPMYKGICGIDAINEMVQATFNKANLANRITYGTTTFLLNDKVLQLVNQPEDGVMNGDIGTVVSILEGTDLQVDFGGTIVKYNVKDLDNLQLAYAVSVHKAQGSEFKMVILPLTLSYRIMLKRKLLYTAITRAKEKLVLIGDLYALKHGIFGLEPIRNTLLRAWLNEEIDVVAKREPTLDDFM
jgi:exodeoxyribonuclease V alpha subunit